MWKKFWAYMTQRKSIRSEIELKLYEAKQKYLAQQVDAMHSKKLAEMFKERIEWLEKELAQLDKPAKAEPSPEPKATKIRSVK